SPAIFAIKKPLRRATLLEDLLKPSLVRRRYAAGAEQRWQVALLSRSSAKTDRWGPYGSGESISVGKTTTLFQTAIRTSVLTAGYDVTHDGRFLQLNSIMETSAP